MTHQLKPGLLAAAILSIGAGNAAASGFQLLEGNASGLGNAFAGTAAVAEDASTIFFNPAGLSFLSGARQFTVGVDAVKPSAKFSNDGSTPALAVPPATLQPLGTGTKDAGSLAFVPFGYIATEVAPRWRIGLGVNAPFGLKTEYDESWIGRFHAVKSDIKTVNINPSAAYKLSDTVSLGFGLNYQKLDAELSSVVNYSLATYSAVLAATGSAATAAAAAGAQNAARPSGLLTISADDWAWGYNLGVIFQLDAATRIGVAYRSSIDYHVTGNSSTSSGSAALNAALNRPVFADIELPDTFTISGYRRLNDKWELLGDLSWTGWAKIQDLTIKTSDTGAVFSTTPERWRNTWRAAVGANYQLDNQWKLRFGLAFDQSPVSDEFRTPRLPDNDRTWLSFGAQYRLDKNSAIDFGYSHLFIKDSTINDNGGSAAQQASVGLLRGNYENNVNILGIQYSSSF